MSQPIWEFVDNLGDASPLDHGGLFLYRDTTGVYGFEMEQVERADEDENGEEIEDGDDEEKERWTVRRVGLDQCKLVRSEENTFYLVSAAYQTDWPHPLPSYKEWFADDLTEIASTMGTTRGELETALCSEDGRLRAWAYQCIADHHGWDNFDSNPNTLTRAEVEERYTLGELGEGFTPIGAITLKNEHMRLGSYSTGKVRLPNCRPSSGSGKWEASPGDLIEFAYPSNPQGSRFARVLGRVDARSEGEHCPAHIGWLAVLELGISGSSAFLRWIDPAWVTYCGTVPGAMLAWFFAPTLPGLPAIMKLNSLGSLSDRYIAKYTCICETCIVEHGLFAGERPCTHNEVA